MILYIAGQGHLTVRERKLFLETYGEYNRLIVMTRRPHALRVLRIKKNWKQKKEVGGSDAT